MRITKKMVGMMAETELTGAVIIVAPWFIGGQQFVDVRWPESSPYAVFSVDPESILRVWHQPEADA